MVQTPDNKKYVSAGGWFKLLVPRVRCKFMCLREPEQLSHMATPAELIEHFKSEK